MKSVDFEVSDFRPIAVKYSIRLIRSDNLKSFCDSIHCGTDINYLWANHSAEKYIAFPHLPCVDAVTRNNYMG